MNQTGSVHHAFIHPPTSLIPHHLQCVEDKKHTAKNSVNNHEGMSLKGRSFKDFQEELSSLSLSVILASSVDPFFFLNYTKRKNKQYKTHNRKSFDPQPPSNRFTASESKVSVQNQRKTSLPKLHFTYRNLISANSKTV